MSFVRTLPVVALALVAAAYSSAVYAASGWADLATVSTTMGIQSGHLCIGDAPAGDVGCPSYAPSVTTAGNLIVSGTVSATGFIGDGSGLTNINAANVSGLSADRITSGTTEMVANGATNMISITTAGVTTGYFTGAGLLVLPGVSVTTANGISSTNGYFSGALTVGDKNGLGSAGLATYGIGVKGNILISNTSFAILSWSGGATADRRLWDAYTDGGQFYMRAVDDGYTSSSQFLVATRGTGANSASITQVIFPNGNIGVGTNTPSTTFTVSGTVWASKYSGYIRTGLPAPTSQTQSIVNALDDLSDVAISGASNGNVLTYNGSSWVNSTPATTSPAGNNTEIQFNNSGTFGAASGLTWTNGSSLLNATNIASNNVTTADASADRILLNKAGATCDASHDGTLRRNPTTGVLQICRH